jgi:hypothetical protein
MLQPAITAAEAADATIEANPKANRLALIIVFFFIRVP